VPKQKNTREEEPEGKAARTLLTEPTPALSDLKVGRSLTMKSRGREFTATVVNEGGRHMLRVAAIKNKLFGSLSGAAMAVTGLTGKAIAQRGAVAWGLMKQPNYQALAGASAPPKRTAKKRPARKTARSKSAKASAPASRVKTRPAIRCTVKGCKEVFASTADASKHVAEAH